MTSPELARRDALAAFLQAAFSLNEILALLAGAGEPAIYTPGPGFHRVADVMLEAAVFIGGLGPETRSNMFSAMAERRPNRRADLSRIAELYGEP